MVLWGCTYEVVGCDDTGPAADPRVLLLEAGLGLVLLGLLALAVVVLVKRRRPAREPVTRVWVSTRGDVVRRDVLR